MAHISIGSFFLAHASLLIRTCSCLIADTIRLASSLSGHTSLLGSLSRLLAQISLRIHHCSYRRSDTSLLLPSCPYHSSHTSLLVHNGSCVLCSCPHRFSSVFPCPYVLAHNSVVIPPCSYLLHHTSLLIPHCSYLVAHTSLLIPHCLAGDPRCNQIFCAVHPEARDVTKFLCCNVGSTFY